MVSQSFSHTFCDMWHELQLISARLTTVAQQHQLFFQEYKPERFNPENSQDRDSFAFAPFSAGPR